MHVPGCHVQVALDRGGEVLAAEMAVHIVMAVYVVVMKVVGVVEHDDIRAISAAEVAGRGLIVVVAFCGGAEG